MSQLPLANISIDLDNKWSYLQSVNRAGWEQYPTYLPLVCSRIAKFFDQRAIRSTVFVVGKDLENAENRDAIASLHAAGHELANHSYSHHVRMASYSVSQVEFEIHQCDQLLRDLSKSPVFGFRGPGFADSPEIRNEIQKLGYRYCASPFPSSVGPLARCFYKLRFGLGKKAKDESSPQFGSWRDAFSKNYPYRAEDNSKEIWVLPVTVFPVSRLPIHFSYLLYLSEFSELSARTYFFTALKLCRLRSIPVSLLLHPLDFLGGDDDQDLQFFPGMKQSAQTKLRRLSQLLDMVQSSFRLLRMVDHVASLSDPSRSGLPLTGESLSCCQTVE